jgi:glycosidase
MMRSVRAASDAGEGFIPGWARDALIYHIYPLGFLGAPRRNRGHGPPVPRLLELRRWYDHLSALGVNTLQLGPVFESQSHGYDTIDMKRIDRRLGHIESLRTIVDELHQRGIRILLDGVFNHTGRRFFAFEDLRQRGQRSPYAHWYHVDFSANNRFNDGFSYAAWHGSLSLPELNLQNEAVRDYLLEAATFWQEAANIDGWRLDAAGDVTPAFWRAFRQACKQHNPDCFLFGELVFGEYDKYLGPGGLDGATHYPLYDALMRSFAARRFGRVARLLREYRRRPPAGALVSFLGNHDVTRLRSRLNDEADFYPATVLLMTLPFVPCWYYGDECGMAGEKSVGDAALREAMPRPGDAWPDASGDRYHALAQLASLRAKHRVLRRGALHFVRAERDRLAFVLHEAQDTALVIVHAGDKPSRWSIQLPTDTAPPGATFHDALNPELPAVRIEANGTAGIDPLPSKWGRVLMRQR